MRAYVTLFVNCPEQGIEYGVTQAMNAGGQYIPSAGDVREMALEYLNRQSSPVLDEMKMWTKSDPEWPEVKEFMKLYKSVSAEKDLAREKQKVFIRPTPSPAFYDQRKALIEWYLRQDLYDGQPRSKSEIAAIKATQPQRKRKHADLQHR